MLCLQRGEIKKSRPECRLCRRAVGANDGIIESYDRENRQITVVFPQLGRRNQRSKIDLKSGKDLTFRWCAHN